MTDTQILRRILAEAKKLGGPHELIKQFSANITLEERSVELSFVEAAKRRTIALMDQQLKKRYEDERLAQEKHEQFLAHIKQEHDQQLARMKEEQTRFTNKIAAERMQLTNERDAMKNENATLAERKQAMGNEIAIGLWLLALVRNDPQVLGAHKLFLSELMDPKRTTLPAWTDLMANAILKLARRELTNYGMLVPVAELEAAKREAAIAKQEASSDRFIRNSVVKSISTFINNPMKMTTDQKRVLLEIYAQLVGHTQEGFAQLMKRFESSEKCPAHRVPMVFDYQQGQWICPIFSCMFRR
jgi:hypothetical protein